MKQEDKEYVQKHGVIIKNKAIEEKPGAQVYLIRHGFSEFNYRNIAQKQHLGKEGQSTNSLKADPRLCDAQLHPIGVQ